MGEPALDVVNGEREVVPDSDGAILAEVTSHVTRYLAAQIIADPTFPNRDDLPKSLPPPFCNFGHQLLIDYERLLRIVWSVALNARTAAMQAGISSTPLIKMLALAAWLLSFLSFNSTIILSAGIVLLGAVVAHRTRAMDAARKAVAKVRAEALQQLLENRFGEGESLICVERHHFGDGALDGADVPVLTVLTDGPPFPGFGRLQVENLFVCRPKAEGQQQAVADLTRTILDRVAGKAAEQPQVVMRQGEVIVVHGGSLSTSSGWLGSDHAPILWLSRAERERVQEVDPRASVRIFHATQIVFPRHTTAATFFLRVFPAGNSIAFQISVTTLGPPTEGMDDLLVRLSRHKLEEQDHHSVQRSTGNSSPADRDALRYLDYADLTNRAGAPFQGYFNAKELRELDVSEEQRRGVKYDQLFSRIVESSPLWPGRIFDVLANLREDRSLTFPSDFFGRPEAIAHVHTVYDQIVRSVLETIEEGGFDTSEYRDSDGKLLIQADKIDQLIVGEKITMQKKEVQGGQREAPKPQAT